LLSKAGRGKLLLKAAVKISRFFKKYYLLINSFKSYHNPVETAERFPALVVS